MSVLTGDAVGQAQEEGRVKVQVRGRRAVSLYEYKARSDNELSFTKGDKLVLLDDASKVYSLVCKNVFTFAGTFKTI